jgi:LPXTG-site transpeptidase (sortase) family protein
MSKSRSAKRKPTNSNVIGGQWLPSLLIWGGVLLMLTGGVIAYPTVQNYLAPPDAESLEFIVTVAPLPTAAALQPTATPEAVPTATPEAIPTATSTAPPPIILPETELVVEETPTTELQTQVQAEEEATPEPTATPLPTPTPDPASLKPNRIVIPAIDLDAPVVQVGWETRQVNEQLVSSWIVPDMFAAGWHVTSALPGNPGNTVLNGHHNIHGEVFRDLIDLLPGDEVIIYTGQTSRYYAVTERHILEEKQESAEVRQQNAHFIMPTEDERLTMVTCWPYTNNTHRLIIVAFPTEPMPTVTPVVE